MTERDKKIIDLYLNHPELSTQDIANQFNISTATISRVIRINNIPRRHGNSGVKLSLEDERTIVEKYLNSTPLLTLQKEYKISYDRIKNIISKYTTEKISSAKRLNPTLIENYFEIIDSNEKAYWLGWIISDGAITNQPEKNKYQLELTIKAEDEEILQLLAKDLGVPNNVYSSGEKYKRFSLGSKKIIQDLAALGITQNKTFTVAVPIVEPKFFPSLIRGLFDGDGGYTIYKRSSGQINRELNFCGNEQVVSWIRKTLLNEIPTLKPKSIEQEHSIKRIRWGSLNDIKLINQYLYANCGEHYLKRKRDLINVDTEVSNQIAKGQLPLQSVEGE